MTDKLLEKEVSIKKTEYQKLLPRTREYLYMYKRMGEAIPTLEGLACYIPLSRLKIDEWLEDKSKKEFLEVVDRIFVIGGSLLKTKGLTGEFNTTFTKFLLSRENYGGKSTTHKDTKPEGLSKEQKEKLERLLLHKQTTNREPDAINHFIQEKQV